MAVLPLAWRSLGLASIMLVVQSCIVADPPQYKAAGQTRPELNSYSAVPPTTKPLVVLTKPPATGAPVGFSVPVRSEDAGEALRALYFLDYQTSVQNKLVGITIPASTYDNTNRTAPLVWPPAGTSAGCHFVTLVVAHTGSFLESDDERLDPTVADEDASLLTWTVNVDPTDGENTLLNCPSRDEATVP
jgi:hypothetical protein